MLSRKEAARYLAKHNCKISPTTLLNMATHENAKGKGPPYFKDGRRVFYSTEDLDAWRLRRLRRIE
jgi:hypothetical protein